MQRINETEAKQIALEYVKTKESGAQAEIKSVERQDMWVMETQTKETNGTQYANVTVSGTGEVKDYERTTFRSSSASQRIKSKLRNIFCATRKKKTRSPHTCGRINPPGNHDGFIRPAELREQLRHRNQTVRKQQVQRVGH